MRFHQAFLVIGLLLSFLWVVLLQEDTARGPPWRGPPDPLFTIALASFVLSFTVTPISIVNYFSKQSLKQETHKTRLGLLAMSFYAGFWVIVIVAQILGLTSYPSYVAWIGLFFPPTLTILVGWG